MSDCEFCGFDNENNPLDNGRYCNDECELGHAYEQLSKLEAELLDMTANAAMERLQLQAANKRIEKLEEAAEAVINTHQYYEGYREPVAILQVLRQLSDRCQAALESTND